MPDVPHTLRSLAVALLVPALVAACAASDDSASSGRAPGATGPHAVDAGPPLVLERTIPLPDVSGRMDHMALDARRGRLAVAALGNGTVEVVSVTDGVAVARIEGLPEPQGVEYVPGPDRFAVACGGDGSLRLYDAETLTPCATVDLGGDADNVHRAADGSTVWVAYGHGGLAEVDAVGGRTRGTAPLPTHPEGFALETQGGRAFVNLASRGEVAVVDRAGHTVTDTWSLGDARANFPAILDEAAGRLYVGCRRPSCVMVVDTSDGSVRARLECSGDPDDLFVDARRSRLYAACGSGTVDVFDLSGDAPRLMSRVETAPGARTALLSPDGERLFLAVPRSGDAEAEIRVYSVR